MESTVLANMRRFLLLVFYLVHVLADTDFAKFDGAPPSKIGRLDVYGMFRINV